ncbi:hypothetical protein EHS25_004232 [Saitozyma podzolica]|uniref:Enoyl reductase (ER) domain-containing protein n=1 Tax=Saitozyma podzolica TaxID=1890683 RepID=A0A427YTP2_9TREE|nr:hypothetical protein EHS25_004232 [Saitozyma podzolica]
MSSDSQYTFQGWAARDNDDYKGSLKLQSFDPKPWDEDDVDVRIMYCGICGSDVHVLSGAFFPVSAMAPLICGHELVGEVIRVGSQVENGLEVGTIVGVGAVSNSCRECEYCVEECEVFCKKRTTTYAGVFHRGNGAGYKTKGGYASHWRGPSAFAYPIPAGYDPACAAPMMCAGITVFSALRRFGAGVTAKQVGVIGIGVTTISRGEAKRQEAAKLGSSNYIAVSDDVATSVKGCERTLDLVICCTGGSYTDYLKLLKPRGTFVQAAIGTSPVPISNISLITGGLTIVGALADGKAEYKDMFDFAAKHNIKPWINRWDMKDINKALPAFTNGEAKYRMVLVNTENGGSL